MGTVSTLPRRIYDTLTNLITGMNISGRNKAASDYFDFRELTYQELENAYRSDWLARKIIEIPPGDMTREWRDWKTDEADIEQVEAEEDRLGIRIKVRQALIKDRLYGGAALVLGAPGDPSTELRPESIGKGGLQFVHVLTRYEITAGLIDRDPMSPFFGEPKEYFLSTGTASVTLHPSRVIRFISFPRPSYALAADGWGDSLLQSVYDAVHHAAKAQASVAALLDEARIDVIKIPRLMANIGSDDEKKALLQRFSLANLAKGQNNILLMDSEEEWEQKTISFAMLPELISSYLQVAAGAADIPITRLLGESPKGLRSSGDGEMQNYYDAIVGRQNADVRPALERLDQFLVPSALGSVPKDLWWDFAPLWQLSEKDRADVELKRAQATQVYVNSGLIDSRALGEGVVNQLVDQGVYPGLEKAIEEAKKLGTDPTLNDPNRNPANDPNNPDNMKAKAEPKIKAPA